MIDSSFPIYSRGSTWRTLFNQYWWLHNMCNATSVHVTIIWYSQRDITKTDVTWSYCLPAYKEQISFKFPVVIDVDLLPVLCSIIGNFSTSLVESPAWVHSWSTGLECLETWLSNSTDCAIEGELDYSPSSDWPAVRVRVRVSMCGVLPLVANSAEATSQQVL